MADYDLQYQDTYIDALLATANELKTAGYIYKGVATPSTNPGTPTERVAYLASEPGTYTNFGGIVIASGLYSLTYAGGTWTGTQMQAGSDIEVVQTTGQSTSAVMSQKAVTDAIQDSQTVVSQNTNTGHADIAVKDTVASVASVGDIDKLNLEINGESVSDGGLVWSNGYVAGTGIVTYSDTAKYSQPFLLRAGVKLRYQNGGSFGKAVVQVSNTTPVFIGDTVTGTVIINYQTPNTLVEYTAQSDMYIVISTRKEGGLVEFVESSYNYVRSNILNTYFIGNGTTYVRNYINGLVHGRTYRVVLFATAWSLPSLPDYNEILSAYSLHGQASTLLKSFTYSDRNNIPPYFDITIPSDSEMVQIGGRAVSGEIVRYNIIDITELNANEFLTLKKEAYSFPSNGYWVSRTNGELVSGQGYSSSDFENSHRCLFIKNLGAATNICFYDSLQTFISGVQIAATDCPISVNSPYNAKYIRMSTSTSEVNAVEIYSCDGYSLPFIGETLDKYFPIHGKKICSLGDSITWGYTPHGLSGEGTQLDSYAKLAAQKLGCSFVNYGISDTCLANSGSNPMCIRYTNMDADADIVTFMGGTNDIRNGVSLGTMSDRVNTTYYGALHTLIEGLYRKYILKSTKNVKVIAIVPPRMLYSPATQANGIGTPYPNQDDWANAVIEVANYYGIPYVDFYHSSYINPTIASDFQNTAYGQTGYFNPLIADGVHLSQHGQDIVSDLLCGFIKSLF